MLPSWALANWLGRKSVRNNHPTLVLMWHDIGLSSVFPTTLDADAVRLGCGPQQELDREEFD
jgi:hypothetical protein